MAIHIKKFNRDKALEVMLLISKSLTNSSLHQISKILYLSDKLHLEKYGRLICGDQYFAFEYGPVPSAMYEMMKVVTQKKSIDVDWDELMHEAFSSKDNRILTPKRDPSLALISESEVECINETVLKFGKKTFDQLTDITHDAAWHKTNTNQAISLKDIVSTLPNHKDLEAHLFS